MMLRDDQPDPPGIEHILQLGSAFADEMRQALLRHASDEDGFYTDEACERRYNRLARALSNLLGDDVSFGYSLWSSYASFADQVFHHTASPEDPEGEFLADLRRIATTAASTKLYGIVPLEARFRSFPEQTNFEFFKIINPAGTTDNSRRQRVLQLLDEVLDLGYGETRWDDAVSLLEHFENKTTLPFASRPLLCVALGSGLSQELSFLSVAYRLEPVLSVLRIMSIDCVMSEPSVLFQIVHSARPELSIDRLPILIAGKYPGAYLHLSNDRFERIESNSAAQLDSSHFINLWNDYGKNLYVVLSAIERSKIHESIERAVSLVGRSLFPQLSDTSVYCAIGLETVLNPFGSRSDLAERLAVFGSSILGATQAERAQYYRSIKKLYSQRSAAVHQGKFGSQAKPSDQIGGDASFRIFLDCMKYVIKWILQCQEEGFTIDERSFEDIYLRTISKGLPPE